MNYLQEEGSSDDENRLPKEEDSLPAYWLSNNSPSLCFFFFNLLATHLLQLLAASSSSAGAPAPESWKKKKKDPIFINNIDIDIMINLKDIHSMDFIRCFPGYGRKERMKTIDIYNGKIELRVVRQNFDEFKWGVYCNKNSYIYIYSSRRIRESREILIIVLFVYNVTRANQDTRALTRVRYILECAWWKKKKRQNAVSQAPVKTAFVKRFYALCFQVPATCLSRVVVSR